MTRTARRCVGPQGGHASTRRSFIRKAGAALSAPLAAGAAAAPVHAATEDRVAARLARLEDINAIRVLNHAFARQVNAGAGQATGLDPGIRGLCLDDFGERDVIAVSPDGQTAVSVMHCSVLVESAIGPSCPLVDMAREQGSGFVSRSASGVFEQSYLKRDGVWTLQRSIYSPA